MGVPFTDVFLRSIFLVSSSGGGLFDGRPVTLMSLGAPLFFTAAELVGRFCHLPDWGVPPDSGTGAPVADGQNLDHPLAVLHSGNRLQVGLKGITGMRTTLNGMPPAIDNRQRKGGTINVAAPHQWRIAWERYAASCLNLMDVVEVHPSQTGTELRRRVPSEHEVQYSSGGWRHDCRS